MLVDSALSRLTKAPADEVVVELPLKAPRVRPALVRP